MGSEDHMREFKVVARAMIEHEIIQTDSKDPILDIMMAGNPVYPILEARRVSGWFSITPEKAEDILEDLFCRNHLWRKKDKTRGSWCYCESPHGLGMSDREVERQRKSRVAVRRRRLGKGTK